MQRQKSQPKEDDLLDILAQLRRIAQQATRLRSAAVNDDCFIRKHFTIQGFKSLLDSLKTLAPRCAKLDLEGKVKVQGELLGAVRGGVQLLEGLLRHTKQPGLEDLAGGLIAAMEDNVILRDVKYMSDILHLYLLQLNYLEEQDQLPQAVARAQAGIDKANELKALHEIDPPVPEYILRIIADFVSVLKGRLLKYRLQSGAIQAAQWKKRVEEDLPPGVYRVLGLVQGLKSRNLKLNNKLVSKQPAWREQAFAAVIDSTLKELKQVSLGLSQDKQKRTLLQQIRTSPEEKRAELIKKKRELDEKALKEKAWRGSALKYPLELHVELLRTALDLRHRVFEQLFECAQTRIKLRRHQVLYINQLGILYSKNPNANVPNGFEKQGQDLNMANLKTALTHYRNTTKDLHVEEKAAPPAPGKDDKKGAKDKEPKKEEEPQPQLFTQQELKGIDHKFVHLLVKRSPSPQSVLVGVEVVLGDEETGPNDPRLNDWKKIAIPEVSNHQDSKRKGRLIPYLVFKVTEEYSQEPIIQVRQSYGSNELVPAQRGFQKLSFDLRMNASESARSQEYLYLTYKTDRQFFIIEREVGLAKAFWDLEESHGKVVVSNLQSEQMLRLDVNYDLKMLDYLSDQIHICTAEKPQVNAQRIQFLNMIAMVLWEKYLRTQLFEVDTAYRQRASRQLSYQDFKEMRPVLARVQDSFCRALLAVARVLSLNPKSDLLFLSKITIELTKLLEARTQYPIALGFIQHAIKRIQEYRDWTAKPTQRKEPKLPWSITVDFHKATQHLASLKTSFLQQKHLVLRKLRQKGEIAELPADELDEMDFEFRKVVKHDQSQLFALKYERKFSKDYQLLVGFQTDLLLNYFRIQLKQIQVEKGEKMRQTREKRSQIQKQGDRRNMTIIQKNAEKGVLSSGLHGQYGHELMSLPKRVLNKINLAHGSSQRQAKHNLQSLSHTLIASGKIQPPRPRMEGTLADLKKKCNKNCYLHALLNLNMALASRKQAEQKFLLNEAIQLTKKALQQEDQAIKTSLETAFLLLLNQAGLRKQYLSGKGVESRTVPVSPILVNKGLNWVEIMLPPFVPLVKQRDVSLRTLKQSINAVSLYGKKSANGVNVSMTCDELRGTGQRMSPGDIIRVDLLDENEEYCFACAAWDGRGEVSGGIGSTGPNVSTALPLPAYLIASRIGKAALQLGQHQISLAAVSISLKHYTKPTQYLDKDLQFSKSIPFALTLDETKLACLSLIELKAVAEALVVKAHVMYKRLAEQSSGKRTSLPKIQTTQLQILNLLLLACKVSVALQKPPTALVSMLEIASRQIDKCSSLLGCMLITPGKTLNEHSENQLLRLVVAKQSGPVIKKLSFGLKGSQFRLVGRMMQFQQKREPPKKGAKDPPPQPPKVYDKFVRILVETKTHRRQYEDLVALRNDEACDGAQFVLQKSKQSLEELSQYCQNTEEIEKIGSAIQAKVDLYDMLKDPLAAAARLPAYKSNPLYLEMCCRLAQRLFELGEMKAGGQLIGVVQPSPTENSKLSKQFTEVVVNFVRHDVDLFPYMLFEFERLKQLTQLDKYDKSIELIRAYRDKYCKIVELEQSESDLLQLQSRFSYECLWLGQLRLLQASSLASSILISKSAENKGENYWEIQLINLAEYEKRIKTRENTLKSYRLEDKRLEQVIKVLKCLAEAAVAAQLARAWTLMQNVVSLTQRLISVLMLTPFSHKDSEVSVVLGAICWAVIAMLRQVKDRGVFQFQERWNEVQSRRESAKLQQAKGRPVVPTKARPVEWQQKMPKLFSNVAKKFWFANNEWLNMSALAGLVSYEIHSLHLERKKNSLIAICRQFSNVTEHKYSIGLVPFMENSLKQILSEVQVQLQAANDEIKLRTEQFEKTKANKKNKRQAIISGEKSKEEKEFQADALRIGNKIKVIQDRKTFQVSEVRSCSQVLSEIWKGTNQLVEASKQLRRQMVEFGSEEKRQASEVGGGESMSRLRKSMLNQIIGKSEQIKEGLVILREKGSEPQIETEIRNLSWAGDLSFAGGLRQAEVCWTQALENILLVTKPIDNYPSFLTPKLNTIAAQVGTSMCFNAVILLNKLGFACYYNKLNRQRSAYLLAADLLLAPFLIDMRKPDLAVQLVRGRKNLTLENLRGVDCPLLTDACQRIAWFMYDYACFDKMMPVLQTLQSLANDVLHSNFYSALSKNLRVLGSAELGLINDCLENLYKLEKEKDMPSPVFRDSIYYSHEKGKQWKHSGPKFVLGQPITSPGNKQLVQALAKLQLPKGLSSKYGPLNAVLFSAGVAATLLSLCKVELQSFQANEVRLGYLKRAEALLREALRKLGVYQQLYQRTWYLLSVMGVKEKEQKFRSLLTSYGKSNLEDQGEYDELVAATIAKKQEMLNHLYRLQMSIGSRQARVALMARMRILLSSVSQAMGQHSKAYLVLKYAIINSALYAKNRRLVEQGSEPESVQTAEVPVQGKDAKKAPKQEKKEAKKGAKVQDDSKKIEDELKIIDSEQNFYPKNRTGPNHVLPLKMRHQLARVLYRQNRQEQILQLLESTRPECERARDQYFKSQLLFLKGVVLTKKGLVPEGQDAMASSFKTIQGLPQTQFLCFTMAASLAEFYRDRHKQEQTLFHFQKASNSLSQLLKNTGYEGIPNAITEKLVREQVDQENYKLSGEQEQYLKGKADKKGKKDDKKGKQAKKDNKKGKDQPKPQYRITPFAELKLANLQAQLLKLPYSLVATKVANLYAREPTLFCKLHTQFAEFVFGFRKQLFQKMEGQLTSVLKIADYTPNCKAFKAAVLNLLGLYKVQLFDEKLLKLVAQYKDAPSFRRQPLSKLHQQVLKNLPKYSQIIQASRPLLIQAKELLKAALLCFKGQTIAFYNPEKTILALGSINLRLAEYSKVPKPKHSGQPEVREGCSEARLQFARSIDLAISSGEARRQLFQNYLELGKTACQNMAKLDLDIVSEIVEIDLNHKVKNSPFGFDQSKKKTVPTAVDLLQFYNKMQREACSFSFQLPVLQLICFRLHRFLLGSHPQYRTKVVLPCYQLKPDPMQPQWIIAKLQVGTADGCDLYYALGSIPLQGLSEEAKKGQEKYAGQPLIGTRRFGKDFLDKLLRELGAIRAKYTESEKRSPAVKERDFKNLRVVFRSWFLEFMTEFCEHPWKEEFVPDLGIESLDMFQRLISGLGIRQAHPGLCSALRRAHLHRERLN